MADRVRRDLVPAAVQRVHVVDAPANLVRRAAEVDPGRAARLMRPFVDLAARIGDEVDAADEEGEVQAVAVPIHLRGEIGELLPALELGAVVERHDDELRRSIDAGLRGRHEGARPQESQCGHEFSRGQFSPPTEVIPAPSVPDSRVNKAYADTGFVKNCGVWRRGNRRCEEARRLIADLAGDVRAMCKRG